MIAGPTAIGKTAVTIDLALHYGSVILSADARQFYRELDIGSAKPDAEQLKAVRHYFIDHKSVTELYGAGHFEKDALQLLDELYKEHDIIFLTGGSGLYINAVLNGVDEFTEVPLSLRNGLNEQFRLKGLDWLQQEVKQQDPIFFETADVSNPQRLIRALEVSTHTGLPYSSFLNKQKAKRDFIPIKILLSTDREKLYHRINTRVDEMMKKGLLAEVKQLVNYRNYNALKTVGYKELYDYLDGKYDLATAVDRIKQHTRNYAKRQITWFKNKDRFEEFEPGEPDKINAYIYSIVSNG